MEVSTITCTCKIDDYVDIISIGKYLECDQEILGIKLVYAGDVKIIKGTAKPSKKKHDFMNQCTLTVRNQEGVSFITSVKVFNSGVVHFTGVKSLEQAQIALEILKNKLKTVSGFRVIKLAQSDILLLSHDNLVFGSKGQVIGYKNSRTGALYLTPPQEKSIEVEIIELKGKLFFQTVKYFDNCKYIYTVTGVKIGVRRLIFYSVRKPKRNHQIISGYVLLRGTIIGKEEVSFDNQIYDIEQEHIYQLNNLILHQYSAIKATTTTTNFKIHMINGYFKVPYKFTNSKLHEHFINQGYYSRFDPCAPSSVNLRFHYNKVTNYNGKCPIENKTACTCTDISVLCFASGKINVTGLQLLEQGKVIHAFIMRFFQEWVLN